MSYDYEARLGIIIGASVVSFELFCLFRVPAHIFQQMLLFVIPCVRCLTQAPSPAMTVCRIMVIIGWIMGNPLTLLFDPLESVVLYFTVVTIGHMLMDGKSNWLKGAILICLYVMIAIIFWYYPGTSFVRPEAIWLTYTSGTDPLKRYSSLTCTHMG
jgi:hypothetical protein